LGREGCAHTRSVCHVARDIDAVVLAGDADLVNLAVDIVQAPTGLAAGTASTPDATLTSVTALTSGAAVTASARVAVVAALEAGASATRGRRNAIAARGGKQGKN